MKLLLASVLLFTLSIVQADDKFKMAFNNEDLTKVIEIYAKATGQKFVVDPSVRGKITIFVSESVAKDEAFNLLSSALATNGYAISQQGDTMIIKAARSIQRDLIEVSTEKPTPKPERMYTWIYNAKNVSAENIMRELRMLTSKDGEMSASLSSNQIIISDWVSNILRVSEILKVVDQVVEPATAKLVQAAKKEEKNRKEKSDN